MLAPAVVSAVVLLGLAVLFGFLAYVFFGNHPILPEVVRWKGASFSKAMTHQWLSTEGVFAELLRLVREEGLSALIATHNMDHPRRMHRELRMEAGKLVELPPVSLT